MCGIIGYVGHQEASAVIVEGLRRLEYRGYDSAGVAILNGGIHLRRAVGKLINLADSLAALPLNGSVGVGHTRWATHGRPTEPNAHPHVVGRIAVVHNGIIENHHQLRAGLVADGHVFSSETDTEIFSHLINAGVSKGLSLEDAVCAATKDVSGAYAIAVLDVDHPECVVVAKQQSPLILGVGAGETFCASDIPAILMHTRDVIFMEDGDMAILTRDGYELRRFETGIKVERAVTRIEWSAVAAEKDGYEHFMLKEIHEQPRAITDTIRGRISMADGDVYSEGMEITREDLANLRRIVIIACGTSWHAALIGKQYIEEATRIPVEVDLASEFRYRNPIVDSRTLVIAVSQSGETADTLAALKESQRRGARAAAVVNVIGSSIARAAGNVLYTHAGPEIGVASTKAFTTQMAALYLIAVRFGRILGTLNADQGRALLTDLLAVPGDVARAIELSGAARDIAKTYVGATSALYLGRGLLHPIALEGALKLKEISYIHAEGYAAGEMKHGPIALVDEFTPTIIAAPRGPTYEKTCSNLQEVAARGGAVIAIGDEDDDELRSMADAYLPVPRSTPWTAPFVSVIPMQLLAYHLADLKGTDIDQPRNLAKSVTVE